MKHLISLSLRTHFCFYVFPHFNPSEVDVSYFLWDEKALCCSLIGHVFLSATLFLKCYFKASRSFEVINNDVP